MSLLKRLLRRKEHQDVVVVTCGPQGMDNQYVFRTTSDQMEAAAQVYRKMVDDMRPPALKGRPVDLKIFWYQALSASMQAITSGNLDAANLGLIYLASALKTDDWRDGDFISITFDVDTNVCGFLINKNDPLRRASYTFGNIEDEEKFRQKLGF